MQDSITTTIMQVGKPMKVQTTEYIIYHYVTDSSIHPPYWRDFPQTIPTKQSAIDEINEWKSSKTRKPDDHYKLIKRETIETEIEL